MSATAKNTASWTGPTNKCQVPNVGDVGWCVCVPHLCASVSISAPHLRACTKSMSKHCAQTQKNIGVARMRTHAQMHVGMQPTWHQLPPEQVSIRMNAVDQIVPNCGYKEGSLQSLAYMSLVSSGAQIPPPMRSAECHTWPPMPAEVRRHNRSWRATTSAATCKRGLCELEWTRI